MATLIKGSADQFEHASPLQSYAELSGLNIQAWESENPDKLSGKVPGIQILGTLDARIPTNGYFAKWSICEIKCVF
jgi:hypothetical protein